jgi:hypothetical protein
MNESRSGWFSWGPGGPSSNLPEAVREELLSRAAEREERRGRLLAVIQVQVWENGESDQQVSFPEGSVLSPLDGRDRVADVVRIARDALTDWR